MNSQMFTSHGAQSWFSQCILRLPTGFKRVFTWTDGSWWDEAAVWWKGDLLWCTLIQKLTKMQKADINLVMIWECLDTGPPIGHNILVHFAIHLLSVVTNSASCKQVFSEFGIMHMIWQNCLLEEKVHKTAIVKMDLWHEQLEAGFIHSHKKHQFSHLSESLTTTAEPGSSSLSDSACFTMENGDSEDGVSDEIPSFMQLILNMVEFQTFGYPTLLDHLTGPDSTNVLIPLKDLFNYSNSIGHLELWKGGFGKLEDKLEYYKCFCSSFDSESTALSGLPAAVALP